MLRCYRLYQRRFSLACCVAFSIVAPALLSGCVALSIPSVRYHDPRDRGGRLYVGPAPPLTFPCTMINLLLLTLALVNLAALCALVWAIKTTIGKQGPPGMPGPCGSAGMMGAPGKDGKDGLNAPA